jgi:hypothetical protein
MRDRGERWLATEEFVKAQAFGYGNARSPANTPD